MKYLFPTFMLLLTGYCARAQHALSRSLQHSFYTYVYRVSEKETAELSKNFTEKADEAYLHTLVDSFKTGDPVPALKDGNYLLVYAAHNHLHYQLYTAGNIRIKVVDNGHDQLVVVHDKQGRLIPDAAVYLNKRRLSYNPVQQAYGPAMQRKNGAIKVDYKNTFYYFPVRSTRQGSAFFYSLTRRFPLKYIFIPASGPIPITTARITLTGKRRMKKNSTALWY
jgi:hypothetical protein